MDKENLKHLIKHDLFVELKASLAFIQYFIQDLESQNMNQEEINRNLNILKETFKKLAEQVEEMMKE